MSWTKRTVSGGGGASGAGAGKQTVSIDERSSEQKEKDEKEHRMQVMLVKKVHEKFEIDMDAPGIFFPLNPGNANIMAGHFQEDGNEINRR